MKKILVAAVAMLSLNASAEYKTEIVCGAFGETGECVSVTYKVRPPSAPVEQPELCAVGEGYGPCPTEYGVPEWLQDLNQWFIDHGATPNEGHTEVSGPN